MFNHPIDKVFHFFSCPDNLSVITPGKMEFQLMTPTPITMSEGKLIDYTMKIFGVRIRWRSLITFYHTSSEFIDEQVLGPYSFWHHKHRFQEFDQGTLMTDTVTYTMPYGFLGRFVHWSIVRGQLDSIFTYREQKLEEIFSQTISEGVNT